MEQYPPSYESAVSWDAWLIIARYIPSVDLCAAALVSRKWHEIFLPFLWGAPASHFGTENDAVYVALTRFKRTLKRARLSVRMLTHTLHLPPALSEIYGGPRAEWLKDLLDYLPCLQSLIVSELPFFDHNATIALRPPKGREENDEWKTYHLRLLLAQSEPNTTSIGLASALARFTGLLYLDLSYTSSARDRLVLSTLSEFRDLQILKLRGIGMRDEDVEFLAEAIRTRVRFLDLRNNMLGDRAVRSLMQSCFLSNEEFELLLRAEEASLRPIRRTGQGTFRSHAEDFLKRADFDERALDILTSPLTGRSVIENLPHVGITHLYIADNHLTIEGVASLISGTRINVLDVGTVDTAKSLSRVQSPTSTTVPDESFRVFPGSEKLIPLLSTFAKETLTCLRINHSIVTKDTPFKNGVSVHDLVPELAADDIAAQMEGTHLACELDGSNCVVELPADTAARFELADTAISSFPSPTENSTPHKPAPTYQDPPLPIARGPAFAPELVTSLQDEAPSPVGPRTILHPSSPTGESSTRPSLALGSPHASSFEDGSCSRTQKICELLAKRPKDNPIPLRTKQKNPPYLHPSHLPQLDTLILTDVPSHAAADSPLIDSLIRLITACSDEAMLATLQARADYSLPPGRARILAEQQYARSLFALQRIVLEITPAVGKNASRGPTGWKSVHHDHPMITRSATGDMDSEQMWTAASEDFSFFGNEECGVPDDDASRLFPMPILNDRVSLGLDDTSSSHSGLSELEAPLSPKARATIAHNRVHELSNSRVHPSSSSSHPAASTAHGNSSSQVPQNSHPNGPEEQPPVDVVAALASFRRRKKAEYEDELARRLDQDGPCTSPNLSPRGVIGASPSGHHPTTRTRSPSSPSGRLSVPVHVSGYWKGEVKIIRNATPNGRTGAVDIYGNYFEKGYLYP